MLGLAGGPPGRWPRTTGGPQTTGWEPLPYSFVFTHIFVYSE